MKYLITLICCLTLLQMNKIYGQNLSKHQWENRLLVIKINDTCHHAYQAQLQQLIEAKKGLTERKLIIYHIKGREYKTGLQSETIWEKIETKQIQKKPAPDFEVILIGLDGRIKLRQSTVLTTEKLFSIIDAMPMRIREIQNQ